jgi:hypothetical protein
MSAEGPYRLGKNGLEYLGHDIEDVINDQEVAGAKLNVNAATKVSFAEYYPGLHQLWLWVATGTSDDPDTLVVFHPLMGASTNEGVRGGWSVFDGHLAAARCACLFSNTLGASMSKDLKPHVGRLAPGTLLKADSATSTTDAGTAFRAYLLTKPLQPAGDAIKFQVFNPIVVAQAAAGVQLQVTVVRDDGEMTKPGKVMLTPRNDAQTRVRAAVDGATLSGCKSVQYEIGDKAAIASSWRVDQIIVPYAVEEQQAA